MGRNLVIIPNLISLILYTCPSADQIINFLFTSLFSPLRFIGNYISAATKHSNRLITEIIDLVLLDHAFFKRDEWSTNFLGGSKAAILIRLVLT